jgi:hypothetical protein
VRNSKLQTPSFREASSFKLQEQWGCQRVFWRLGFDVSLKLGV